MLKIFVKSREKIMRAPLNYGEARAKAGAVRLDVPEGSCSG
jgi:hypothetical protein